MAQPEKRENSVLFSLRELKQIEEKRVAEEEQQARDAEMARIRAKEDDDKRRRDAEDAKLRAQQDEERRIRETAEQRAREDALRLQEAEARARQEAAAALEAHRLQQELDIRRTEANKKRPIKIIALFATLAVAGAGLVAWQFMKKSDEDKAHAAEADKAREAAEKRAEELNEQVADMQTQIAQGQTDIDNAQKAVDGAQNQADRDKANAALADLRKAQAARADRLREIQEKQRLENKKVKLGNKNCIDNPLGC